MDENTLVVGDNSRQFFIFGRPGEGAIRNGSLIRATAGFHGVSEWFCDRILISSLTPFDLPQLNTWYYTFYILRKNYMYWLALGIWISRWGPSNHGHYRGRKGICCGHPRSQTSQYIRYKSVFISSNHDVLVVIVLRSGPRGTIWQWRGIWRGCPAAGAAGGPRRRHDRCLAPRCSCPRSSRLHRGVLELLGNSWVFYPRESFEKPTIPLW